MSSKSEVVLNILFWPRFYLLSDVQYIVVVWIDPDSCLTTVLLFILMATYTILMPCSIHNICFHLQTLYVMGVRGHFEVQKSNWQLWSKNIVSNFSQNCKLKWFRPNCTQHLWVHKHTRIYLVQRRSVVLHQSRCSVCKASLSRSSTDLYIFFKDDTIATWGLILVKSKYLMDLMWPFVTIIFVFCEKLAQCRTV